MHPASLSGVEALHFKIIQMGRDNGKPETGGDCGVAEKSTLWAE